MKILNIDSLFLETFIYSSEFDLATQIIEKNNFDAIWFYPNDKLDDSSMVKLLKCLRLQGNTKHIVFESVYSLAHLVKENPLNAILLSKGITFFQIGEEIKKVNFEELAEKQNLIPYFRSEIDLKTMRHSLANIWGASRIKEILQIDDINSNHSFDYYNSILDFITEKPKEESPNLEYLAKKIKWFKSQKKTILYYDDKMEIWLPILQHIFGEDKVLGFNPEKTNEKEIFQILKQNGDIGCVLLDLRLKDEKDYISPINYSGGIILKQIKRRFSSLPVIMFTASNKAESIRMLMNAGAEYLWSKEGVDDRFNIKDTVQHLIELVDKVEQCFNKYKNPVYKIIADEDYKISRVNKILLKKQKEKLSYLLHKKVLTSEEDKDQLIVKIISNAENIVFDTNYLINCVKYLAFSNLYIFLINNKRDGKNKVIIHEDVLEELFILGLHDENVKSSKYSESAPISRFLLKKLIQWKAEKLIFIEHKGGKRDEITDIAKISFKDIKPFSVEEFIGNKSLYQKIASLFYRKNEDYIFLEEKVNLLNSKIDELKEIDFKNLRVFADRTFIKIIKNKVDKGNTLFVAYDKELIYKVGETFCTSQYNILERKIFPAKDKETGANIEYNSIVTARNNSNSYTYNYLSNSEFDKILKI